MKINSILLLFLGIIVSPCLLTTSSHASGSYAIGKDAGGVYFESSQGGSWYIGRQQGGQAVTGGEAVSPGTPPVSLPPQKKEMKVIIHGNQVLVPVKISNHYKKEEALLILDTGASITILHRELADKLHLKPLKKEQVVVAGGGTVPMAVVKLSDVAAGPVRKKNIYAGVIDFKGGKVPYQGLLGMNFLKGVKYQIDFDRQLIRWEE